MFEWLSIFEWLTINHAFEINKFRSFATDSRFLSICKKQWHRDRSCSFRTPMPDRFRTTILFLYRKNRAFPIRYRNTDTEI